MNYLAHLFLSGKNPEIIAGNFLTDFLNLKELNGLPDFLQPGREIHLKIDNFTDNHAVIHDLNEYLWQSQGKYAPVALDIILDYFLSYNWSRYSEMEYNQFCQYIYIVLGRFIHYAPDRERRHIQTMIDHRWLSIYSSISGLYKIMEGMDRRTKFPSKFNKSVEIVEENFDYFNEQFNLFFPEINTYIREELDKITLG